MDNPAGLRSWARTRWRWPLVAALLVVVVVAVALPRRQPGAVKLLVASPSAATAARQPAGLMAGVAPTSSSTSPSTRVAPAPTSTTTAKAKVSTAPAAKAPTTVASSTTGSKAGQSTGTPPSGLPEPACAKLPPGVSRASLRGGQWMSNRADGSTANYKVYIEALPCDLYDNERGQINIYIGQGPPETTEWTVDYGDGTVFHNPAFELCHEPNPVTWMTSGSHDVNNPHVYAQAGTYDVRVQIVIHPCDPTPGAVWPGVSTPTESTTLNIPVQRVLGPRPYPAPEIAPIVVPRPNP